MRYAAGAAPLRAERRGAPGGRRRRRGRGPLPAHGAPAAADGPGHGRRRPDVPEPAAPLRAAAALETSRSCAAGEDAATLYSPAAAAPRARLAQTATAITCPLASRRRPPARRVFDMGPTQDQTATSMLLHNPAAVRQRRPPRNMITVTVHERPNDNHSPTKATITASMEVNVMLQWTGPGSRDEQERRHLAADERCEVCVAGWLGRDCDFIVVNTIEVRATGDPRVRVYRAYGKKISFGVLPEGFTPFTRKPQPRPTAWTVGDGAPAYVCKRCPRDRRACCRRRRRRRRDHGVGRRAGNAARRRMLPPGRGLFEPPAAPKTRKTRKSPKPTAWPSAAAPPHW